MGLRGSLLGNRQARGPRRPLRALVTGGSGVVGKALVAHLLSAGDHVKVLTRSEGAASTVADLGAEAVSGDILDYPSCLSAASGADVVYHVAGLNDMCPAAAESLHEVNVAGTRTVARAAATAGVKRLVYTSSAAAHEPHPTAYGLSKLRGERVAFAEAGVSLEVVAVSPTSVQGPGRSDGTARLLLAILDGRLRFLPDTSVSVIDIGDCAKAHRLAAIGGRPGANYAISGATIVTSQIGELRRAVGLAPCRMRRLPRWWFHALAPVVAFRPQLAGIRLCPDLLRAVLVPHAVDGSAAANELGFEYTPIAETLQNLLEWARSPTP